LDLRVDAPNLFVIDGGNAIRMALHEVVTELGPSALNDLRSTTGAVATTVDEAYTAPMSSRELFYHAQCFDGAISCVVAWDYFDATAPVDSTELRPVGYEVRDRWLTDTLPMGAAVVDFLFHPGAEFWADHHGTTFLNAESRAVFEAAGRRDWLYDAHAKSCAGLLYRRFARERAHRNPAFEEAVAWAERIDSADYESVEEAVIPCQLASAISLSFAVRPDPEYSVHLVRRLREMAGDISAVASDPAVRAAIDEARQRVEMGISALRRGICENNADVVTFDVEEGDALIPRYAPYLVNPDARYSAGIVRRATEAKITTMRNPWRHFQGVNLGSLCARYGGGGHERVGSILLRDGSVERAGVLLQGIVDEIRSAKS
jgi:hypothetical protein